jgi:hypothetical protein
MTLSSAASFPNHGISVSGSKSFGFQSFRWASAKLQSHDLDRDRRVAHETTAQLCDNCLRQLLRRPAARFDRADQRHGDPAAGIHQVGVSQVLLPEHDDAQAISRVERVGRFRHIGPALRVRNRDRDRDCFRRGGERSFDRILQHLRRVAGVLRAGRQRRRGQ